MALKSSKPTRAKIQKVVVKDKVTLIDFSTSRNANSGKEGVEPNFVYTNWFGAAFFGEDAKRLTKDDVISIDEFTVSQEVYEKPNGEKVYPVKVTVWKWGYWIKDASKTGSTVKKTKEDEQDEIDF
jgi:hypothetical protein